MIPFPNKKYNIIYADPPWRYDISSNNKKYKRYAESHYDIMSFEDIIALPISDIADKNCALFLWITSPNLNLLPKVLNSWGFKYKTVAFNWIKTYEGGTRQFGLGFYTRSGSELCILAMKGKLKVINKSIRQVVMSNYTRHSEKPAIVRDRIVQLFGDLPRIELFARHKIPNWDAWGNQVPKETKPLYEFPLENVPSY